MLEAILRAAAPETQLTAYNVSSSWRAMATFVVGSIARSSTWLGVHHPCGPVEFGDPVHTSLDWNQPSCEEISTFERDVVDARQMLRDMPDKHTELSPFYFPARLSQANDLTQTASDQYQILEAYQKDLIRDGMVLRLRERRRAGENTPAAYTTFGTPGSPDGQPTTHTPKWLDFTQFDINPYFSGLFADNDRISLRKGRIDIAMRRGPNHNRVYDCDALPSPDALGALIGQMFFTNPPCKQVSIGICKCRLMFELV